MSVSFSMLCSWKRGQAREFPPALCDIPYNWGRRSWRSASPRAVAAFEAVPNQSRRSRCGRPGSWPQAMRRPGVPVKQAKDMPRQVLLGRIGIHYRLLFRTDEDVFDVLDLVTRENLMTTLKRIRSI